MVLREAFFGVTRYGYFQRNLGIARSVLASRLAALVELGLLKRVRYRTDPDWYEYRLTAAGLELFAPMLTIKAWADDHLFDESEGLPREIHRHSCGEVLRPVVVCECCGKPCSAADVEYEVVLEGDLYDTPEPGSHEHEHGCGGSAADTSRPR
jgi:DNA-binding HxlR family transcriptional regulator